MADIGKRIKKRREMLGITQEELAAALGYKNKSSIGKIEAGVNDIVQSKVVAFAHALDTTPAYLMGWTSESSSSDNLFSMEERDLISSYRLLPPAEKAGARAYMDRLASPYKKESAVPAYLSGEAAAYGGKSAKIETTEEKLKELYRMKGETEEQ